MANPNGPGGTWNLTFEDTFPGTSLNTTYWQIGTGVVNNVQCFASNVIVNNGLTLQLANSNSGAEIFTNTAYNLPVGSVCEARIWFPGPGGTPGTSIYNWPAWWVSGPGWPNAGEIDIAEGLGTLTVNYHGPGSSSHNTGTVPGNWSNSWHTYTVRRNTSTFDVWYDGVLVRSGEPTADNGSPQNMILNVGAANTAAYGASSYVMVSYVRQWAPVSNVNVDFTANVCAVDPLGAGLVISEFGGNPIPALSNTTWQNNLKALAPGHCRFSLAWYNGNPGYGAGGSPGQQGSGGSTAIALLNLVKNTLGAVPLISFNGNTADNNFVPADGASLVHFFNGASGGGGPSVSGTLTQAGGNPGQQFQTANTGPYLFQFNEWNSTQAYSCNYSYVPGSTPVTGFSVASSSISVSTSGAPGAYSSLVSGNHAVGSPNYASSVNSQFPVQNSAIAAGQVLTSVAGSVPGTGAWDFAYDIWFSSTPRPTGGVGNNGSGLEMMIWLNHNGGISPAGSPQAAVTIGGVAYTPWVAAGGPVSYVRNVPVNSVTNLDLKPFITDAVSRGLMTNAWYLIDVECGFEIWTGGAGLAITNFSCTNGAGGGTGGQNGGPVRYWSIGNEPGNSAPYTSGSGTGSAPATLAAMLGADPTIVVGAPAAFHWDSAFLNWAAANLPGLGALSYHAYDGFDTDDSSGAAFPNGRQIYNHIKTDIPAMRAGVLYGIEEMNWHSSYNGTSFNDWHNTCFLADSFGQALSAGGHATVYSDSNGGLGLLNDGGGQGQIGAYGQPQAAYWGLGIWTGMNGQFKRWGTHMVSAATTFSLGSVTVFASDSGKIVVVNKDASTAHALTIALTLPGGVTTGTYNVWATNQGSPSSAISQVVTSAGFTGSTINYTIPAGTAVSIDVTASTVSGVTLTNNFEGGTPGTGITTGNSGGASGNAFDGTNVANGTAAFSGTQVAHGSVSMAVSTTSGSGTAAVNWAGQLGSQSNFYGRAYVYLPSSAASDDTIIRFLKGGAFAGGIVATAAGHLSLQNAASGVTTGPVLPTGQWLRIEWHVVAAGAGSASLTASYYVGDSATIAGTVTDTAGAYGVTSLIDEVSYGWNTSHPSQPTIYFDDLGVSTSGFLGPVRNPLHTAAASLSGSGTMSGRATSTVGAAALSGSGTASASGSTIGPGRLANSFEGGTPGTAISPANSGGASGNAFDAVSAGAGNTAAFSATHVAHGSVSGQFSTGAGAGIAVCQWLPASLGTQPVMYGRAYVYLSARPSTDDNIIAFYGSSGVFGGGIMIASSGQLRIQNAGFGELGGGPVMPTGQWFRLEWRIICGPAGSASAVVNYYSSADSNAVTSVLTDTAGAYGSGGSIREVDWGWTSSHASQPALYLDSIGLSPTGFLGPVITLIPSSAALAGTGTLLTGPASVTAAAALSGTGTLKLPAFQASMNATPLLTAGGRVLKNASAALSASPALTATGSVPMLIARPAMTVTALITHPAAAALHAPGTLSAATSASAAHLAAAPVLIAPGRAGSAVLLASPVLTASGQYFMPGAASLAASAHLTAAARAVAQARAVLAAHAVLAAPATVRSFPVAHLTAAPLLRAVPAGIFAHLAAAPSMAVTARRNTLGAAALHAQPVLGAAARNTANARAALAAAPSLTASSRASRFAVAYLSAAPSVHAQAVRSAAAAAHLAAPGALSAAGRRSAAGTAHLSASPVLGAAGAVTSGVHLAASPHLAAGAGISRAAQAALRSAALLAAVAHGRVLPSAAFSASASLRAVPVTIVKPGSGLSASASLAAGADTRPGTPFPQRPARVQPAWQRDVQRWALHQERQRHAQALWQYGELMMFALMWRPQDIGAGFAQRCTRCFTPDAVIAVNPARPDSGAVAEAQISAAYGQGSQYRCPLCYGTQVIAANPAEVPGVRALLVRPAILTEADQDQKRTARGNVNTGSVVIQSTPDFRVNSLDYALRADGRRYQLAVPARTTLRTGFGSPWQEPTAISYNLSNAALEDPKASVAYVIPPSQEDLAKALGTYTRIPADYAWIEQVNGPLIPEEAPPPAASGRYQPSGSLGGS